MIPTGTVEPKPNRVVITIIGRKPGALAPASSPCHLGVKPRRTWPDAEQGPPRPAPPLVRREFGPRADGSAPGNLLPDGHKRPGNLEKAEALSGSLKRPLVIAQVCAVAAEVDLRPQGYPA